MCQYLFTPVFRLLLPVFLLFSVPQIVRAQCTAPAATLVHNTSCTAGNGSITFTAPSPTANYQYSIDGGNTFGAPGQTLFSGLFGGTYPTVSKLISTGCVSSVTNVTLTNPATPGNPTATVVHNTNCTTPNGSITFTGPSPVAGYVFSINNGISFGAPGQITFTGLNGGTYNLVAKNTSSNCVSQFTAVTINNPTVTAPSSTVTNVTNCNTPNGGLTFTAPIPTASYRYSIDGGTTFGAVGQTSFPGLAAGSYSTVAKLVSSGCVSPVATKTISNPTVTAPVSTAVNVTNCNTPNGSLTFTSPSPTANYQYSIDGGATFGTAGQTGFSGLAAGSYSTVAKLVSSGCVSPVAAKTITKPNVTAPTSTVTNVTNCNTPNGGLTFTAPTPTASYQYSIDGGVTFGAVGQTSFPGLAAGSYNTVAKLVSSGCVSPVAVKTIANPTVTAPTGAAVSSQCNTPTGSITFSAPTPTGSFSFSIDGGTTWGTPGQTLFSNLAAGTYTTKTRNANGCVSSGSTTITVGSAAPASPVSATAASTSCNPYNGSITFSSPTPFASYQFSIDSGMTFGAAGQSTFSNLAAGTYKTVVRNIATGCLSPVVSKTVTTSVAILTQTPTFTRTNVTNCATPNGSITFTAPTGATTQYSLDAGTTYAAAGTVAFSNLAAGTYTAYARSTSTGCVSLPVTITITKPTMAGSDRAICLRQTPKMAANTVSGASWTAMAGNPAPTTFASSTSATTTISGFAAAGTYNFIWSTASCSDTVRITVTDCQDPIGCVNTAFLFQGAVASPSDIYSVDLATGDQTLLYSNVSTPNSGINGVGYNVTDGHIWGSLYDSVGVIARIGADGVPAYYFIPGLPDGYNVGAVDNNGVLYLFLQNSTTIYRVDVNPASPTYLTLLSPVLNTTAMNIADWAVNPVDGYIYAVSNSAPKSLLKINPNTGMSTTLGTVTADAAFSASNAFGAAYFDAQGNLYVADNTAGGIYKISTVQNVTGNTTAALRSQGQTAANNDGALCQFACIKPDAGSDATVCISGAATMSATQVSGIGWSAQPGNPGTATISDPTKANTSISGFSAMGTYYFIWTNGGTCNDTAMVKVINCVADTTVQPQCDTCVTTICNLPNPDFTATDTTVYSTCGLSTTHSQYGSVTIDASGCLVWVPNGTQPATDTVSTCIVRCNGNLCDTTLIFLVPGPVVLPLELGSFTATAGECRVLLGWETIQEISTREFVLERSTNGSNWTPLAVIAAAGSSTVPRTYSYVDTEPVPGRNLYRLKMTDLNGAYVYSNIASAVADCPESSVAIFPNPSDAQQGLKIETGNTAEMSFQVYDATGRLLREGSFRNRTEIKGLLPGMYLIKVGNASLRVSRKVIVR